MKKPESIKDVVSDLQLVKQTIKEGFKRGGAVEQNLITFLENSIEKLKTK